jgi:hypothetical protein
MHEIIKASELLAEPVDRPVFDKIDAELNGDASRAETVVKVDEIDDAVIGAYHKAATIEGLLRSPKGRQKTAIIKGLVRSLMDDVDTVTCAILEARNRQPA